MAGGCFFRDMWDKENVIFAQNMLLEHGCNMSNDERFNECRE